jgi:hypothetical protein
MKHDKTFEAIAKLKDIEIELRRLKTVLEITNKALDASVLAEREACAKVVEDYCGAWDDEGYALAAAIRARGKQ